MKAVCPRCGGIALAPTAWSSAWRCDRHGEIHPLSTARQPSIDGLNALAQRAEVPVWVPWPLPHGWLVTGFAGAGDERTGLRGTAVALSGPHPLGGGGPDEPGGPADLVLVAEEPGVGLGAGLAGLPGPDPGDGFAAGPPAAAVEVDHHEAPLWLVEPAGAESGDAGSDRVAAFAGEIEGGWVWALLWPDTAGVLLCESLRLRDLRDPSQELDVPFGALSTRLPA